MSCWLNCGSLCCLLNNWLLYLQNNTIDKFTWAVGWTVAACVVCYMVSYSTYSYNTSNHNGCKQTREECYSLCYLLYGWSYMYIRTLFLGRRYFLLYSNILQNWYLYWNRKMSSIQTDLYRSCCNVNTVTPSKTKPPLCLKKTGVRFLQVNLTKMSYIGTLLKGWSIHQFRQASLYSLIFLF